MTATFVPQNSANYTTIRYYTQLDPYFYSVDNRPLQDIEANLLDMRQYGSDSSRRAVMINSISSSIAYLHLFAPAITTYSRIATGLKITMPVAGTIRVNQGATYEYKPVSDTISTSVIKQAMFVGTQDFAISPTLTTGQSIVYTIEATYTEFTTANMATSPTPYTDTNNNYLPSTLLNAELRLNLNTGTAATTGSQVPPATTAGYFPLYNLTYTFGVTNPVISAHTNSPYFQGLTFVPNAVPHTTNGAALTIVNNSVTWSFPDVSTSNLILPISIDSNKVNLYKPITLKLTFAPTVTGGACSMQISYLATTVGTLFTTAMTTSAIEVVSITAAANAVQEYTLATAVIPNTVFAGFTGGAWALINDKITVVLTRLGSDAGDTNTGTLQLLEVEVVQ